MKDTLILSGFPGTGKSFLYDNQQDGKIVLDSDSSKFDKSEFPGNYIKHIKDNIGKVDIICVSSHEDVRDALIDEGIGFTLVYPFSHLKDEYLDRYKQRKSPQEFINLIDKYWDVWIKQMESQKYHCNHLKLNSQQFISDIIK